MSRQRKAEQQFVEENFGRHLRSLREAQGLTLRALEKLTGISNSFLSQIESGKRGAPGVKILEKLAKVFGPTIWDVFKGSGIVPLSEIQTLAQNPDLDFILKGYQLLSKEDKRMFKEWLEFKLKKDPYKENFKKMMR